MQLGWENELCFEILIVKHIKEVHNAIIFSGRNNSSPVCKAMVFYY
jgi:hypothetical protein